MFFLILFVNMIASMMANDCFTRYYKTISRDGPSLPPDEIISSHKVGIIAVQIKCYFLCEAESKCVGFNYRISTTNDENCQLTNLTKNRNTTKRGDWILLREIEATKREEEGKQQNDSGNPDSQALFFRGSTDEYAILDEGAAGNSSENGVTNDGLDAITACFWINTTKNTQAPAVLSYATRERDNEFFVYLSSKIKVIFRGILGTSQGFFDTGVGVSDGEWHHMCITWKSSNGSIKAYKDGALESNNTGVIAGKRIAPSGIWIIGQDQDRYGGGFQQKNAFHGSLTEVNVWNRVLNSSEIFTLASKKCGLGMQGNYKAYNHFVPHGAVRQFKPSCR